MLYSTHFCDKSASFCLSENNFTQREMANMLGVSLRTVENRLREYHVTNRSLYSDVSDDLLEVHVKRVTSNFPRSGTY